MGSQTRGIVMIARLPSIVAVLFAFSAPAVAQDKDRPAEQVDAAQTLSAVVRVRAKIVPHAPSAETPGKPRGGPPHRGAGSASVRLLAPIWGSPLPLGDSSALVEREPALVATSGGEGVNLVQVVSRRPFSGGWE